MVWWIGMGRGKVERIRGWLVREVARLWMTKLIEQLQLGLAISGTKIQFGLARSTGPDIYHIPDIPEEECLLTLAEG